MSERWARAKAYILAQLNQSSTWRGLTLVATASGIGVKPEHSEAITAAGLLVAGLIATLFPDDVKPK